MDRQTISLDGTWHFWLDPHNEYTHSTLSGQPLSVSVPAPWQSQHESLRNAVGTGWYRRTFDLPAGWPGADRLILHVGAADYQAEVWLNGVPTGAHENGYLPFEQVVTAAARPGQNVMIVRVADPPELFEEIPHGKQSWYGSLSGLWQSVWLERRPQKSIRRPRITTQGEQVSVQVETGVPLEAGERLLLEVFDPKGQPAGSVESGSAGEEALTLTVPGAQLWDVGQPNLYTARLTWLDGAGQALDRIEERFGFRTIETRAGQILLNGRPLYVRAALDQDYYPDLTCTPPSLEYIKDQFRKALAMGLNLLRVHIKVADPRYYQAADEVGLLIWTELPNWVLLSERARAAARQTLEGMLERDGNHPSIVIWTIINESWGVDLTNPEHRAWLRDTYNWLKALDPTRLVVGNSACHGNYQVATDIADFHIYYAMPDHAPAFADCVAQYAARPSWLYAFPYPGYPAWRDFVTNPWKPERALEPAPENQSNGSEPLLVSEFGNWGLPDVAQLKQGYGGKEPWWFETGYEWGDGIVYPHGVEQRFRDLHLDRAFPTLSDFSRAHQRLQFEGMKYEIEQMRMHASIQGYVITEFTDVHWECNGLLDMQRNPKAYFEDMAWLNADDVIVPEWERLVLRSGEDFWLRLYLSHYSPAELRGCTLEWSLEGLPDPRGQPVHGQHTGLDFAPYTVNPMGGLHLEIPAVTHPARATLALRLKTASGETAARSEVELAIFPYQRRLVDGLAVYVPGAIQLPGAKELPGADSVLAGRLRELGCRVVHSPDEARLAAALTLTDELRAFVQAGGQLLWLAEVAQSQQTHLPGLRVVDRRGSPWQGDWASSVGWIYRDRLFRDLPGGGLIDFAFAGITPEAVLTGVSHRLYRAQVQAGLAVGWLHKAAALIAESGWGRGRVLASTFRLSQNLGQNPLADYLTAEMLRYMAT